MILDALLVHLICNETKMPFWLCIWAYAVVLNPLNSHVIQWNCRHAHPAPVTSCVSHLEQSLQRGANGWTALLCWIDNEPLTSIIPFQSSLVTIQGQGVCRKWRYLPLRLSLNHCTALVTETNHHWSSQFDHPDYKIWRKAKHWNWDRRKLEVWHFNRLSKKHYIPVSVYTEIYTRNKDVVSDQKEAFFFLCQLCSLFWFANILKHEVRGIILNVIKNMSKWTDKSFLF